MEEVDNKDPDEELNDNTNKQLQSEVEIYQTMIMAVYNTIFPQESDKRKKRKKNLCKTL